MSDKYFNVDIDDPRASAIAEVMSNKTCKKILSLIAEREMSESDIASELQLPLNTVGYNIDKLLRAGLIEKTKTFFWSVKGKKIPTYKLSNKKILISPKKMIPAVPIAIIVAIVGIIAIVAFLSMNDNILITGQNGTAVSRDNSFKQFSSYEQLDKYVEDKMKENQNGGSGLYRDADVLMTASAESAAPMMDSAGSSTKSYSETNIQVAGVDEPDFVKNDGKYIYMISGKNLYIVNAYPAEDMKIISNITLPDGANNLFINGDRIIVFMQGYENYYSNDDIVTAVESVGIVSEKMIAPCYDYGCGGYSKSKTNVLIYDVSDKENPDLEQNYSFDGNYVDARMINNYVYLISQQYLYNYGIPRPLYYVNGIEREISISDIYYSDEYDENFAFTSISVLNVNNDEVESKVYLLGTSGTMYMSENNIYLTSQKWLSYDKQIEMRVTEGIIPIMPDSYKEKIESIIGDEKIDYEKEGKIMRLVYNYSFGLDKEAQSDFNKIMQESLEEVEAKIAREYQKTVVHKINIDEMSVNYASSGEISGYLLNQFSLDEYDGNLRVAVTTDWGSNSLNHLYVLDENMKIIGSVEDLAPGERIYSARFLGERAYMVTFRQVDPLYVIDLSDSENPNVLGYLKITGYSSYLHPYDENHIIGIGMEANEEGRVSGVKIALFDVSDVANPKENAKYEIKNEGQWSWSGSSALYEHKAFLFDKEKNLLVVPIEYNYYSENKYKNWNGAYVFDIDENSITLKDRITHVEEYKPKYSPAKDAPVGEERIDFSGYTWIKIGEDEWEMSAKTDINSENTEFSREAYYPGYNGIQGNEWIDILPGGINYEPYSYQWQNRIQRSLYMDDVLYTVSLGMIKANSLSDLSEINNVEFSYEEPYYPYYGIDTLALSAE